MGAVAVGGLLLAVLLLVVAMFVWQGAKRSPVTDYAEYVIPEATQFVFDRLSDRALRSLGPEDVRSILEWNLHYTQVVAPRDTGRVVIGSGEGLEYVVERAAVEGLVVDPFDVGEVMGLETEYLLSIGAVGIPVEDDDA